MIRAAACRRTDHIGLAFGTPQAEAISAIAITERYPLPNSQRVVKEAKTRVGPQFAQAKE